VFDLFVQVDDARDISKGGLGIGLALVRISWSCMGNGRGAQRRKGTWQPLVVRLPILAKGGDSRDAVASDGPRPQRMRPTCADRR